MMSRSSIRNVLVIAVTTVVILAVVVLVQQPWKSSESDPSSITTVDVGSNSDHPAPAVGVEATDFTATTVTGDTVTLSELRGKPVWLVFGATWCTNCRSEAPDVQAVADAYAGKITVVTIYVGEASSTVKGYVDRLKLSGPQIADTSNAISSAYDILGIPAHFFIDSNGVIQQIAVGSLTKQSASDIVARLVG
ncbi:MAG: TlpA family protein disulfide reductase [Propionibacteriaceae bacterium]|nr:TlpA family protein disulfide reductase [Propionibacteriaceae bacterium]